jgi:hypothetical protein
MSWAFWSEFNCLNDLRFTDVLGIWSELYCMNDLRFTGFMTLVFWVCVSPSEPASLPCIFWGMRQSNFFLIFLSALPLVEGLRGYKFGVNPGWLFPPTNLCNWPLQILILLELSIYQLTKFWCIFPDSIHSTTLLICVTGRWYAHESWIRVIDADCNFIFFGYFCWLPPLWFRYVSLVTFAGPCYTLSLMVILFLI